MQKVPQNFHRQTDQRTRNRIRRDKLIETNGVLPDYRNRTGKADVGPDVLQSCPREWSVT